MNNSAESNAGPVFRGNFFGFIQTKPFHLISAILLIATVYYLAARFSLTLAFRETNASPVWPPTGIAFACVMLFGYRISPGIAIGAFLANYITGLNPVVCVAIAVGNTLEAVIGVRLFRYLNKSESIVDNIHSVLSFLIPVAMGTTMISATIGAISIHAGGYSSGASFYYVWWTWWLGDTVGNIVVAPLILSITNFFIHSWSLKILRNFLILLLSASFLSFLVFGPSFEQGYLIVYYALGIIVISAFHLPVLGTSFLSAFISMFAVWGTISGFGPFVMKDMNESLLFLQVFIGTITATGLILCAVVNERKRAVEELRTAEKEAKLIASEKTVLLSELNHRVKNNLQIIISLLNMHEHELSLDESKTVFRECINRVIAINNIHQALIGTAQPDHVDLSEYLPLLAKNLVNIYRSDPSKIQIEIEADKVSIHHEKALPVGMILNELMVNSLKHAFLPDQNGTISLNLKKAAEKIVFSYSDNGRGVNETNGDEKRSSLGMQLVTLLAKQINGTVEFKTASGAKYRIEFPIETHR